MSRVGENRRRRIWGAALGMGAGLLLAGAAWASEAGGHGGIDPAKVTDLILRTVNFLVFAGLLGYILIKKFPVKDFFKARAQEIAQTLEDLEAQKAAAAQAVKEAEARLATLTAEREKILKQYIAEGEHEKAKILDKANLVAERIRQMAAMTIEAETKKAAQELKEEVVALATKLGEDLIKKKITPTDHQQLVEEYLHKVVERH
jgi:F-type H+-transporting ATPase subunit b